MAKVVFIAFGGDRFEVDAPIGKTLMQVALDNAVPGILGDCGGACSCATCQASVDERWAGRLPPRSDTEEFLLEEALAVEPTSRLCCQLRMSAELDGMELRVPQEQG
jgi:ferredoxin, 2Fe-2S